jgi:hypothetical protein
MAKRFIVLTVITAAASNLCKSLYLLSLMCIHYLQFFLVPLELQSTVKWLPIFSAIGQASAFSVYGRQKYHLLWKMFACIESYENIDCMVEEEKTRLKQNPAFISSLREVST